jgi:fibronectin type 3 domain-containing protein
VKSITRPAIGNHEYLTSGAAGYFDYFNGTGNFSGPAGDRDRGYYSFDVGTWHLIALNTSDHCTIVACSAGSPQETWLKADLAAHPNYCTLAYWHHPFFSSGHDGNLTAMQPLFQALYNADADIVLGGHAHNYERFAPQNPSAQLDTARGIRQFVVGVGGAFFTSLGTTKPNSQVRQNNTYGVLKLTLHPTSYDWQFVPEAGKTFTDSGSASCHGSAPAPDTTKPTAPAGLTATAGQGQVALNWQASTDNVGVTGYRVFRGTTQIASVGGTTLNYTDTGLAAGTYSYTVRAVDAAGNLSDPSNTASATVNPTDTQKPSAPSNLNATATSSNRIDLTWQASTDNVAVAGYRVYRAGAEIASLGTTTSYSDTSVSANTTYGYTVRAVDAAGNLSDPSNTASATTPAQTVFTFAATADARVEESKPRSSFGGSHLRTAGASGARVESYLRFSVSGIPAGTPGSVKLRLHAMSDGTVDGPGVFATAADWKESLKWNNRPPAISAVSDDKGAIAAESWVEFDVTQFVTGTGTYSFGLATESSDGVDFYSRESTVFRPELVVTTGAGPAPDTTPPSPPGNLNASATSAGRIDLTWQASTDNVGVTGYDIYRGGARIASIGAFTAYSDTSVIGGLTYSYAVRALDARGNVSGPSNTATATAISGSTTVLTIPADADARVEQSTPTTNYGADYLRANFSTSTSNVESYLRFVVSGGATGTVQTAKLRVHSTSNGTVDGPAVYTTSSTWSETTINWNTRLTPTSAARDDKGEIPGGSWVEYDVTPFVTGAGTYTFRLATISSDGVNFDSRETTTFRPELVVTLG